MFSRNALLWIVQVLVSGSLIWAAIVKWFMAPEQLAEMWPWTREHRALSTFSGIPDLLGGVGLVLPGALQPHPYVTVYAAYGLLVQMVLAAVFHLSRGEQPWVNIFFGACVAFIAWGRQPNVSNPVRREGEMRK